LTSSDRTHRIRKTNLNMIISDGINNACVLFAMRTHLRLKLVTDRGRVLRPQQVGGRNYVDIKQRGRTNTHNSTLWINSNHIAWFAVGRRYGDSEATPLTNCVSVGTLMSTKLFTGLGINDRP
jgi:hypothetical protein